MSNHQQVTIVRDTAESNGEVDALAAAQAAEGQPEAPPQTPAADRPGWLPEKFQKPEDLAQEVFLRVYRARGSYQPTAKFTTWIHTIAGNVASDLRQRAYRRREHGMPASVSASSSGIGLDQIAVAASGLMPTRQADRGELRAVVQQALAGLNDRQRMAVLLAKFEQCSYEEIAASMKISVPAVKSLLVRARDQLRAALEPYLQRGDS